MQTAVKYNGAAKRVADNQTMVIWCVYCTCSKPIYQCMYSEKCVNELNMYCIFMSAHT